ncbi:WNK4_8 [Blepharisma stoltei]|uniref:Protein kinase domain-containing protein n=1 Tax=Blepharisma stoltei TaxID=1481888 RepID=A0AAU9KCF0_9CILI|nr:unnamed protein product [Blepharisma stoltei]
MERVLIDNELNSTRDEEDEDLSSLIHSYPNNKNEVVEVSPKGRFFRFNDLLGSGAYKTVYRGLDNDQGCEVAWNSISLKNLPVEDRTQIAEEVKLNRRLNHPNIVHFISAWTNPNKEELVFISELVTGGSLRQYLKKIKFPRLKVIKSWCKGILLGLQYLHSQKPYPIIHRDLKCDNIFIMSNTGDVKIGDFGLSTIMRSKLQTSVLGTPEYMAPEVYEGSYDTKVDIFSFGMCITEMCTLSAPYKECKTPAAVYRRVMSRILPESLKTIQDEEVQKFIALCLEIASKRPSADELLNNSFLTIDEEDPRVHQAVPLANENEETSQSQNNCLASAANELEKDLIESSLIIKDNRGALRQVTFQFDLNSDTPETVAEEMVRDLALDPALVIPIANEIEILVFSNSKNICLECYHKEKNCNEKSEDFCIHTNNNRAPIYSTRKVSISAPEEAEINNDSIENVQIEHSLEDLLLLDNTTFNIPNKELPQINEEIQYPFRGVIRKRTTQGNDKENVIQLQQALSAVLRTRVKVNGFYGQKCENIVKKFQDREGFEPDGIVSEELWNKLMVEYSKVCEEDSDWNFS